MKQVHLAFLAAIFLSCLTALGDYYLKLASQRLRPFSSPEFIVGAVIMGVTLVGWVYVVRHLKLATVGVIYSVCMVVLLAAIGRFQFNEQLSSQEVVGLGFAVVSLVLLARFN